jgi:hypothetical protein
VVIYAYVYHKYYRSRCVNLEIGTWRLVLEGKPIHQFEAQLESFPWTSFCPKTSTFKRYHELAPSAVMPLWIECRYNCENIPSGIFVTNHFRVEAKRTKDDDTRYIQPIIMQHWMTSI